MKKYNIEGDIDFFTELYKSLDNNNENIQNTSINIIEDVCLISNQVLTDKFVTMNCGHKFNYISLFNDILNHKKKYNSMEGYETHLKQNEIRCPYCREKSIGVLPYYEEFGFKKINGVNHFDPLISNNFNYDELPKCDYLTPNTYFNPNSQNITEVYNSNINIPMQDCKFFSCNCKGNKINYVLPENYKLSKYGDEKNYCYNHKLLVIKQYKQKLATELKEEKKQAKLKEKEEKNLAKLKEKEDLKQTKLKEKEDKKQTKLKEKEEKMQAKLKAKQDLKLIKNNKKIQHIIDLTNDDDNNVIIGVINTNIQIISNQE